MFILEPNENFGEELRERNLGENKYTPNRREPIDIVFYYEVKTITKTQLSGLLGLSNESRTVSDNTFYSFDEETLISHRQKKINEYSSNNAFPPVVHESGQVKVTRDLRNGSIVEYYISVIQSEQRPPRLPKSRDKTVGSLKGTFLENKTGR